MPQPGSPPPGAIPSAFSSPDLQSTLAQMTQTGKGAGGQQTGSSSSQSTPNTPGTTPQKPPRPVGTLPQEAQYLTEDVAKGLLSVLPDFMQNMLGVKPTDTPEEAARKKQMLQRYQQLNSEQQQFVQDETRKRHEAEQKKQEEEAKKKEEEQRKAAENELPMPVGKTRGEGGPGASNKKQTLTKLQNDRKRMTSAG